MAARPDHRVRVESREAAKRIYIADARRHT